MITERVLLVLKLYDKINPEKVCYYFVLDMIYVVFACKYVFDQPD